MSDVTLSVRDEVTSVLRFGRENYAATSHAVSTASKLTSVHAFHAAALEEIDGIIAAYVASEPVRPIQVGDRVRINDKYSIDDQRGAEFVVTQVVPCDWAHDGLESSFYAMGDPKKRGVWECFLDRVEADS